MKLQKVLATVLALILALCAAGAAMAEVKATGFPVSDEKVTLTVMTGTETQTPDDINTMTIFKKAEETMNVHIDWITVPQGSAFDDKKALMLATDDLPDIFFGNIKAQELVRYGDAGSFIPMENLIRDYAPNLNAILAKRPELIPFLTAPDGHIYGVPRITEGLWNQVQRIYNINTQWLEALGKPMPTNLAELKDVLMAFKTGDPNKNGIADEIPMTFEAPSGKFDVAVFEYIFGALGLPLCPTSGALSAPLLDIVDGKVVCSATDPRYKEGIAYIHDLFANGLIDPDALIIDNAQWKAKVNANPVVVGLSPNWDYNDAIADKEVLAQYGIMAPLKGASGEDPVIYSAAMYGYARGYGVITKACKNPEAAMRWIDYWFDEINSYEASEGPVGERLFADENGTLLVGGKDAVVGNILPRAQVCVNPFSIRALLKEYYEEKHTAIPSTFPKVDFITEHVLKYKDPTPFNLRLYYSLEESETIAMVDAELKNFINRKAGEWIVNGGVEAEWDSFLAELNKIGLEKYLAAQQTAYDRMMKQ